MCQRTSEFPAKWHQTHLNEPLGAGRAQISPLPALCGAAEVWRSVKPMTCWQFWVRFLQWKYLSQTLRLPVNFCLLRLWKLVALQGLISARREVATWSPSCNVGQEHRPDLVFKRIWVSSRQLLSVSMANRGAFGLPDLGPKSSICEKPTQSMCFIALWWHVH